ncbi:MAG: hypothetical protein E7569_02290 [Ruminococcaceae bacterium]|nr:hypothetical protein [Oscillospiraceae bacterium]
MSILKVRLLNFIFLKY